MEVSEENESAWNVVKILHSLKWMKDFHLFALVSFVGSFKESKILMIQEDWDKDDLGGCELYIENHSLREIAGFIEF